MARPTLAGSASLHLHLRLGAFGVLVYGFGRNIFTICCIPASCGGIGGAGEAVNLRCVFSSAGTAFPPLCGHRSVPKPGVIRKKEIRLWKKKSIFPQ